MERRVLLAISLSFLVLFLYQTLFPPPKDPAPGDAQAPAASAPGSPAMPTSAAAPAAAAAQTPPPPAATRGDSEERDVVVDTTTVRAVFTNRGARLKSWALKLYTDRSGAPVDLVPHDVPGQPLPFSLAFENGADPQGLNDALFVVEANAPAHIDATASPAALSFVFESADGVVARKRFMFQPAGYELTFTAEVARAGTPINARVLWGPGLGDEIARTAGSGRLFSGNYTYPAAGFIHRDGSVTRYAGAKASSAGTQRGSFRYAGINDHYFVASVIEPPGPYRVDFAQVPVTDAATSTTRQLVSFSLGFDQPAGELRFFVGPKQFETLSAVNPEFTKVIDYGMFAVLAVPLRGALEWVHGFVGSYGWSIIVLTLLINLVMAPLRHRSVVSMRKMQEIQPQLKALQDRYAHLKMTDPARGKMNEEMMALYREKGASPAGGCLPTLLTLPVLFAFYSLLSQAIEIRGEGFLGWIPDLAQRDPWYITPLLMGVTMFWQQRMQPGTGDPVQQRVMMFMPVMFTFMMMAAPSGLVIYWFVSNLWAIGQQYFTTWLIGPPKAAGVKR